jgi:hypothetical protein
MSFELGVRTAPGMKTADRFRYHRISFRIRLHCGNCDRGYWWEGLFVTNTAIAMSHNEGSGPRRLNPTFLRVARHPLGATRRKRSATNPGRFRFSVFF